MYFDKLACSRGFFGEDCSKKCIDTCAGCNNINGLCDYGCIPGWKGYFCIEGIAHNDYLSKRELFKRALNAFVTVFGMTHVIDATK